MTDSHLTPTPDLPPEQMPEQVPEQVLEGLQQELNRIRRTMRLTLQSKLAALSGRSLGTLELNQAVAKSIQEMLDQHGFRVRCHQCGHAAILRVSPRKGMSTGAFVFDHTIDGKRTFHGGTAQVPPIHLVAKPSRRLPKSSQSAPALNRSDAAEKDTQAANQRSAG